MYVQITLSLLMKKSDTIVFLIFRIIVKTLSERAELLRIRQDFSVENLGMC